MFQYRSQQMLLTKGDVIRPVFVAKADTQTAVTGTLTISKPSGTAENDLMVAFMATGDTSSAKTWTGDTGWTELVDSGTSPGLRIAWKIATASEGSSYSFTCSSSLFNLGGSILTYRNVHKTTPISAGGTLQRDTSADDATNLTASAITVPDAKNIIVAPFFCSHGLVSNLSVPSGMTSRTSDFDLIVGPAWRIFDEDRDAGTTGTRVSTISSSAPGGANHGEMTIICIAHA